MSWLRGAALAGLGVLAVACKAPAERPDVVLVVVDTLRADHLGAYGFPLPTSPQLDRFAEQAVVFERALAAKQQHQVPSHASLMTSRFVREHSVGSGSTAPPVSTGRRPWPSTSGRRATRRRRS